jgi:hypothetical protein
VPRTKTVFELHDFSGECWVESARDFFDGH